MRNGDRVEKLSQLAGREEARRVGGPRERGVHARGLDGRHRHVPEPAAREVVLVVAEGHHSEALVASLAADWTELDVREVAGSELTVVVDGTDAFDMAIDYKHLKDVVKGWEDWLDHRLWLCSTDPLAAALRERPEWDGVVLFTNNPTSETLAQVLADQGLASLRARFGMKVVEVSVTVRETCTTSCTYTARP